MIRGVLLCSVLALSACASSRTDSSARLEEGIWTGEITPMNHPDRSSPLAYEVAYADERLTIVIEGADGQKLPTREVLLEGDELAFVFTEPEASIPLTCSLTRQPDGHFEGRCADAEGKWARFTMRPPAE